MASQIKEAPTYRWPALQTETVWLAVTVRAGLALADYGTITLTIRSDPLWPRTGPDRAAVGDADPVADGWPVSASAVGTVDGAALTPTVVFTVTVPSGAGYRRYALDVVAAGGIAGRVQLVDSTWLTVTPSLLP